MLQHEELTRRLQSRAPGATISYRPDRVVIRMRVRRYWLWWPIRLDCRFRRVDGRVRLGVGELRVRGVLDEDRRQEAEDRLVALVDEATDAERTEIRKAGVLVYEQEIGE